MFKLGEKLTVPRTKIERDSVGKVTGICHIVKPNIELAALLSIFSLDLQSQAQIHIVKKNSI